MADLETRSRARKAWARLTRSTGTRKWGTEDSTAQSARQKWTTAKHIDACLPSAAAARPPVNTRNLEQTASSALALKHERPRCKHLSPPWLYAEDHISTQTSSTPLAGRFTSCVAANLLPLSRSSSTILCGLSLLCPVILRGREIPKDCLARRAQDWVGSLFQALDR